ncbi:MAG TPA: hypothetical protein IAC80_07705 [Candidatus Merdiplasma excrementigallinarum]|uniref:Uncharacterized protein n=1 Tax=Candidatus Merdiplasma excrementigallinarum TaxID=2840864 RepID=A0A9D1P1C8_9FIRM|nr:hypothetical protein [Candidatus Merdiplasma excrementigallinarum]
MKRELSREKKQETEKYLSVMEDLNVVLALLILLLAAIFLMDISGYGLMLILALLLGFLMNLNMAVCAFLRGRNLFSGLTALAALAFLCFSLYLWQVLF